MTQIKINNSNNGKGASAVFSILLVIAVVCSFIFYNKWQKEKTKSELYSESISNLSDTAKVYKIRLNDTVSVMAAKIKSLYVAKENINTVLSDKIDELKAAKVRHKDLKNFTSIGTVTKDSVITIVYVDTLKNLTTEYKDSFMNIKATLFRNNTASIKYECYDDLDLIVKKEATRRFLFFRWKYRDTYLLIPHNPKTRIRKLKVFNFISK